MKVAIGPLSNDFGAVGRITKTISSYSKHEVVPFRPPYYNKFLTRFWKKTGVRLYDPYGFYLGHHILQKFDIIHFMNHPVYREVHFRPTNPRSKYVYRIPGLYTTYVKTNDKNYSFCKKLDEWMIESCRQSDAIIAGSNWWKNHLMNVYNLDSIVIKNGVSVKKWIMGNSKRFEKKYKIKSGFCLYAARLSPEKSPDFFVEVARQLPNIKFVMIGPHVTQNRVSAFIGKSLPDNVTCLGRLLGYDLLDCFSSSKVVIHELAQLGGNVVLEAMASKSIPLVSVESSGVRKGTDSLWFNPPSEGLYFQKGDIRDCVDNLIYAMQNPDIALRAYHRALSEYDWSHIIKKYDQLYDRIV